MSRDIKIALGIFVLTTIAFLLVATVAGLNVTVHTNVTEYGDSEGRYLLNVDSDEENGVARFSVIDTREGYTYVFDRDKADKVIPPVE